jgi:pimeloyl-ACP methyl ester carboxylesterase
VTEHRISTPDGRALQVSEHGDPTGPAVLVHHGTPGSRIVSKAEIERAEQDGIRLISYDRPGYGGSTALPGRTVAHCAADVRAIAMGLGIEQLAVRGLSGGGPHALACAALLPEVVPAVAVMACSAPWEADGLDYFAGMGELNLEDIYRTIEDPVAARAKCEADRLEMLEIGPAQLLEYLKTLLAPVDAEELTGERAEYMVESLRVGLGPGADGWWDDEVSFMAPWGFELESIGTPVLVCHGRQDRFVPFAHGEWLTGRIPSVEARLTDDDGHLTLSTRHLGEINSWLLERVG